MREALCWQAAFGMDKLEKSGLWAAVVFAEEHLCVIVVDPKVPLVPCRPRSCSASQVMAVKTASSLTFLKANPEDKSVQRNKHYTKAVHPREKVYSFWAQWKCNRSSEAKRG